MFDYGGTGVIIGRLDYTLSECSSAGETLRSLPAMIILLAVISIILTTKAELGLPKKYRIHGWFIMNVITNLIRIIPSLFLEAM